jgi:hypothetical protein
LSTISTAGGPKKASKQGFPEQLLVICIMGLFFRTAIIEKQGMRFSINGPLSLGNFLGGGCLYGEQSQRGCSIRNDVGLGGYPGG